MTLEWPTVPGAWGYRIERDVDDNDGVDTFQFVSFVLAPAISRTFTDLRLVEAMNFKYRVFALPQSGGGVLATAIASVTGDLAGSVNSVLGSLNDSAGGRARAMATAMREDGSGQRRHVLAVGQPGANLGMGVVKVYERAFNGGAWTQAQSPLSLPSGATGDYFGASVALSPNGMYLAVGIPGEDEPTASNGINPTPLASVDDVEDSGAVVVYRYVAGTGWTLHTRFKAINAGPGDAFGTAVTINDDGRLLVGAPNEDSGAAAGSYRPVFADAPELGDDQANAQNRGAVYVYATDNFGQYFLDAYVKPPVAGGGRWTLFGAAVALDGLAQRVAIGAPQASYNGSCAGGVVFYDLAWVQQTLIDQTWFRSVWSPPLTLGPGGERECDGSSNPSATSAAYRGLGGTLAMSAEGDWLVAGYAEKGGQVPEVGASAAHSVPVNAGQAVLYRNQTGVWAEHSAITAPEPRANDRFGISVSLVSDHNGLKLLVGAREDGSGHNGLMRASQIVPESFVSTPESGAAYYFVGATDLSLPVVLKARLKSPDRIGQEWLGLANAMTKDGNELLLSGRYKDDANEPFAKAVFFGY